MKPIYNSPPRHKLQHAHKTTNELLQNKVIHATNAMKFGADNMQRFKDSDKDGDSGMTDTDKDGY